MPMARKGSQDDLFSPEPAGRLGERALCLALGHRDLGMGLVLEGL